MEKIAVLTLVKDRHEALANLIKGLELGSMHPDELIVVFMNEHPCKLPDTSFPIITHSLLSEELLPLAKARNYAASKSNAQYLIFLDVDCIPGQHLVAGYADAMDETSLFSGQIRYLIQQAQFKSFSDSALAELSDPDPIRANLKELPYALFWSLNFACSRVTYNRIGGFDESFTGYGGEDTDFAFTAEQKGILLRTIDVTAYHQYHASYSPPLNHFDDILKNTRVFKQKWNKWPMEGWLKRFEKMGLVRISDSELIRLKSPHQNEIDACLKR